MAVTDLDAAIRQHLAHTEPYANALGGFAVGLHRAVTAVLDRHPRIVDDLRIVCGTCQTYGQNDPWPCDTVEDVATALGVEWLRREMEEAEAE